MTTEHVGLVAKHGTFQRVCQRGGNKNLYAIDEEDELNEEAPDNDEELQAWCALDENENEHWQEGDQQRRQTNNEDSRSCVAIESGKQSKVEFHEHRRSEGQMGESQSHSGLWSLHDM